MEEIFAQIMNFKVESQQKNEEKLFQVQKENHERILKKLGKTTTSERKRRKNLKKRGKATTVLP